MRSLNYVQRVSLDFTGTLFPHAICLGDADNDTVRIPVLGFNQDHFTILVVIILNVFPLNLP